MTFLVPNGETGLMRNSNSDTLDLDRLAEEGKTYNLALFADKDASALFIEDTFLGIVDQYQPENILIGASSRVGTAVANVLADKGIPYWITSDPKSDDVDLGAHARATLFSQGLIDMNTTKLVSEYNVFVLVPYIDNTVVLPDEYGGVSIYAREGTNIYNFIVRLESHPGVETYTIIPPERGVIAVGDPHEECWVRGATHVNVDKVRSLDGM